MESHEDAQGLPAPDDDGDPDAPDNWDDERRRAYRASVAARLERQARAGRLFALVVVGLVVFGVVLRIPESWWVPAVGAAALLGLLFRLANWKCPSCGERLPTRGTLARCRGCGAPLE